MVSRKSFTRELLGDLPSDLGLYVGTLQRKTFFAVRPSQPTDRGLGPMYPMLVRSSTLETQSQTFGVIKAQRWPISSLGRPQATNPTQMEKNPASEWKHWPEVDELLRSTPPFS